MFLTCEHAIQQKHKCSVDLGSPVPCEPSTVSLLHSSLLRCLHLTLWAVLGTPPLEYHPHSEIFVGQQQAGPGGAVKVCWVWTEMSLSSSVLQHWDQVHRVIRRLLLGYKGNLKLVLWLKKGGREWLHSLIGATYKGAYRLVCAFKGPIWCQIHSISVFQQQ